MRQKYLSQEHNTMNQPGAQTERIDPPPPPPPPAAKKQTNKQTNPAGEVNETS